MSQHDAQSEPGGRRWGLIMLSGAMVLVGGLFLAHLVWSVGGGKRLNRQVAAYKAAGEPIEPGDFVVADPLSDEDNGALDLRDAFKSIDQKSEAWKNFEKQSLEIPLVEQELVAIRAAVAANPKAFECIDAAMKRKGVDWRIAMTSPTIYILLPHLNEMRNLAQLVSARAMLEFHEGNHAAALADLQRLRFLSEATERPPTLLVTHLVGIGIMALAIDDAQQMAPELKIGDAAGAASKQQVAELMAMLLDDAAQRENQKRAYLTERMFELDSVRCLAEGKLNIQNLSSARGASSASPLAEAANYAIKPIALEDGLIMIRHTTALMEAIRKSPDLPTFKKIKPALPPALNNVRHLVLRVLLPSLERTIETDFRCAGERRMVAVSLAARWYAAEHDGKLPEQMSDLIPKYLPSAPLDPFAVAQPLKYVADPSKPIVYSIGDNGADDGGSEVSRSGRQNTNKWERLDVVTHLSRQPRQYPPTTEESMYPDESLPPPATEPTTQEGIEWAPLPPTTAPSQGT